MIINNGTVSISQGNNYFVRNVTDNVDWEKIQRGNIVFFYGDPLHYNVIESKVETVTNAFTVDYDAHNQFQYKLAINNVNRDFVFAGDQIKLIYSGIEYSTLINAVEKYSDKTTISLIAPLYCNNSIVKDGSGIFITSKNKVTLQETYYGSSLHDVNYTVIKDFTRNLNLPLMDIHHPAFSAVASMYNRSIKLIDAAVEHSRISLPNSVVKTDIISLDNNSTQYIKFNPPLNYEPSVFSQIQNIKTREQYPASYRIENVTCSGFNLHCSTHLNTDWELNTIALPSSIDYKPLFNTFQDNTPKANQNDCNPEECYTIFLPIIDKTNIPLNLCLPYNIEITKIISKTNKGFAQITLKINDNVVEESTVTANINKYVKPLRLIVEKGAELSLECENIVDGAELAVSVYYKRVSV